MKLLRGSGLLLVGEIASKLSVLIFTALFARSAGLDLLAEVSVAQALLMYATVAGDAGLTVHAVRRIAQGDRVETVTRETSSVQVGLAALGLVIMVPIAALNTSVGIVACLTCVPVFTAAAPTYLLQSSNRMGVLAGSRALTSFVTAGTGCAILTVSPTAVAAMAYSVGSLIGFLFVVEMSSKSFPSYVSLMTWRVRLRWVRASQWLIVQSIVVHAYASALTVLGSNVMDSGQFIDLSTALRVHILLLIPANILQTVLLPAFVSRRESVWAIFATVAASAVCIPIAVFLFGKLLLTIIYGSDAAGAAPVLFSLSLSVPISYGTTVLLSYLVSSGDYGASTARYAIALSVEAVAIFILAPEGAQIVALSLLVSESIFMLLLLSRILTRRAHSE